MSRSKQDRLIKPRKVWMITFESKPFVKVGGLGEVPPNISANLTKLGLETTLIMPSHGLISKGRVDTWRKIVIDGVEITLGKARWKEVEFIVIGGDILDDPRVYAEGVMLEKTILLARAIGEIIRKHRDIGTRLPDVMHFHDWHSVFSLMHAKLALEEVNWNAALIYHVHLLIKSRITPELLEKAKIELGREHWITYRGERRRITVGEALSLSKGIAERLGALEADALVTVSYTYLKVDKDGILNSLGWDLEDKGDVIYNGTDWRYQESLGEVLEKHGEKIKSFLGKFSPSRNDLRKYLLMKALGEIPKGEPKIFDEELRKYVLDILAPPFKSDGRVEAFRSDGPLAIMSGRISKQKGIDVLLEAIPRVLRDIGNAKFLFLLLPVWGGEKYICELVETTRDYPENIRVIFGIAPSVFKLAHLAADAFAAPSRWEPFGIMALEAMVTGNPVVASKVGGLSEIVLDIREHGAEGTGLHVRPNDPYELANAIRDILLVMDINQSIDARLSKIGDETLREMLKNNPGLGEKIREASIRRVEEKFTWINAAEMALRIYANVLRRSYGDMAETLN